MLEEKDLQAIQKMIDASEERMMKYTEETVGESEKRMVSHMEKTIKDAISEAESRITRNTVIMMDAEFKKSFHLLYEQIQLMQEMLIPPSRVDTLKDQVDVIKSVVRDHSQRISKLEEVI